MSCILPCAECTQTKNHCCKADIPYSIVDAMHIKWLVTEKYKVLPVEDVLITNHPATNLNDTQYIIINSSGITKGSTVDVREYDCVALIDGKCSIYEDRPNICRQYGTEFMKCRYKSNGITSKEVIKALDYNSIKELDTFASQDSAIHRIYLDENRIAGK